MADTVRINVRVTPQAVKALEQLQRKLYPGYERTEGMVVNKALLDLAQRELQAGWGDWSDGEAEAKEAAE